MSPRRDPYADATETGGKTRARTRGAARPVRTDPIRTTLDLPPAMNRAVKRWCAEAAVDADVSAVPMAALLRILLVLLTEGEPDDDPLSDPEIQKRLRHAVLRSLGRAKELNY
ncbi:hypothetical protein B7755_052110 [Streptomyces sp. NBS 14/10]|uniref:hypothetical protein n=1 Tax=Streptomyces sp. NBS 14/10 TaxID=1945643 RepID=UPI000B7E8512|nr:hypothetical protein [Streptomyces sp. NBS 14/10]KAK1176694.1 hypothetical protein B7755_052110 [Streptomyces sp. NBS 14/10]